MDVGGVELARLIGSAPLAGVCVCFAAQRGVADAGWPKLCSDAATPQLSFGICARAQATLGLGTAAAPLYHQPGADSTFLGRRSAVLGRLSRHLANSTHVRSQRIGNAKLPGYPRGGGGGARDGEEARGERFHWGKAPSALLRTRHTTAAQPAAQPAGSPARGARAEARFHCSCFALSLFLWPRAKARDG